MNRMRDLNDPASLRSRMRRRRVRHLVTLVETVIRADGLREVAIADIGGNFRYWKVFPFESFPGTRFRITLINISEKRIFEKAERPNVEFDTRIGDACDLADVADRAYDISHSNSVIEHVGGWERVKRMRDEIRRTGRHYFVQTPNYWFPVEPHYMLPFIHWLPRPWYVRWLMAFRKNRFDQATENYDSHRMLTRREFAFLFPENRLITERFLGLPKSFIAVSVR